MQSTVKHDSQNRLCVLLAQAASARPLTKTSSPSLDKVNWELDNWDHPSLRQKLAYTILVELLAYQFASPVRWIETRDLHFSPDKFERLIKLGPGPTLTGMVTCTLKAKYEAFDDSISLTRVIYCHAKNPKEIIISLRMSLRPPQVGRHVGARCRCSSYRHMPRRRHAPSAGPAAAVADEPLKAADTHVIIAQKPNKKVEEAPLSS